MLYGSSSAAILQALEDNKAGRLISIDLPAEQHSKIVISGRTIQAGLASPDEVIGSHVPYELRKRWDLRLGDSMKVLPRVLQEHSPISAFVHDSLHTYDHMTAEYSLAYDALDMEGLLISDDVEYNSAWHDFAALKDERYIVLSKGTEGNKFAFLRKSRGAAV